MSNSRQKVCRHRGAGDDACGRFVCNRFSDLLTGRVQQCIATADEYAEEQHGLTDGELEDVEADVRCCETCDAFEAVGGLVTFGAAEMASEESRDISVVLPSVRPDKAPQKSGSVRPGSIALVVPDNASWRGPARGPFFQKTLQEAGYEVELFCAEPGVQEQLRGFRLVVNHCMVMPTDVMDEWAANNPQSAVLHLNHSALNYLAYSPGDVEKFAVALRSARKRPNVWLGSQDQACAIQGSERVIWCPMPTHRIEPRPLRNVSGRPVIALAGRNDAVKNWMSAFVALAELGDGYDVRLMIPESRQLTLLADQLIPWARWVGKLNHAEWLATLRDEIDIAVCVSASESLCYVATEAMQTGVPVVHSSAIRFADDPISKADPNNPQSIAIAIWKVTHDYRTCSERAAWIGRRVQELQLAIHQETFGRLMSGQSSQAAA